MLVNFAQVLLEEAGFGAAIAASIGGAEREGHFGGEPESDVAGRGVANCGVNAASENRGTGWVGAGCR
jgi:hypothetical protein